MPSSRRQIVLRRQRLARIASLRTTALWAMCSRALCIFCARNRASCPISRRARPSVSRGSRFCSHTRTMGSGRFLARSKRTACAALSSRAAARGMCILRSSAHSRIGRMGSRLCAPHALRVRLSRPRCCKRRNGLPQAILARLLRGFCSRFCLAAAQRMTQSRGRLRCLGIDVYGLSSPLILLLTSAQSCAIASVSEAINRL